MIFLIHIAPVAKERPRFNPHTKTVYTPSNTAKFENALKHYVCLQLGKYFEYPLYGDITTPLLVEIDFVFARTDTQNKSSANPGFLWYKKHPDIDNLAKAIMDSCNGILWKDDRQICELRCRKLYSRRYGKDHICIRVQNAGDPPFVTIDYPNAADVDARNGRKGPSEGNSDE